MSQFLDKLIEANRQLRDGQHSVPYLKFNLSKRLAERANRFLKDVDKFLGRGVYLFDSAIQQIPHVDRVLERAAISTDDILRRLDFRKPTRTTENLLSRYGGQRSAAEVFRASEKLASTTGYTRPIQKQVMTFGPRGTVLTNIADESPLNQLEVPELLRKFDAKEPQIPVNAEPRERTWDQQTVGLGRLVDSGPTPQT